MEVLCTAGLSFKVMHGILKKLRSEGDKRAIEINPKDYLALAGMGTIADLVPLKNENRILAAFGLKYLFKNPEPGISALLNQAKINQDALLESEDIAFKIAPASMHVVDLTTLKLLFLFSSTQISPSAMN